MARVGDRTALASLVARLGDESKVVRRAAAEAVRSVGNRLEADKVPSETHDQVHLVAAIEAALGSPDVLTRRGATRVFAAHFRDLSQEIGLADALLARLDDPDPVVQMQAIKGLWRWWYWRDDSALRNAIEDRLIAELAEPTHPWVRRNLTEALYILGDENIRYLYNHWLPSLADQGRPRTGRGGASRRRSTGSAASMWTSWLMATPSSARGSCGHSRSSTSGRRSSRVGSATTPSRRSSMTMPCRRSATP